MKKFEYEVLSFEYEVLSDGVVIAQFVNEIDAKNFKNDCTDRYNDCYFKIKKRKET